MNKSHLRKAFVLLGAFIIVSTLPSCVSLFSGNGHDDDRDHHHAVVRTTTPVSASTTTVTRY